MATDIRKSFRAPEIILKYFPRIAPGKREVCTSVEYAFGCFIRSWNTTEMYLCEEFKVLLLDHGNGIIGISSIGKGGRSSVTADIRLIMLFAIKAMATRIIVAHNHPSGTVNPSRADIRLTTQIGQACKVMDIELLDHLILTPDSYYSFREEGKEL